jgi:hypothetical protein
MAAAALAIAVPPMPVKWTDLIADENIRTKLTTKTPRHKVFYRLILKKLRSNRAVAWFAAQTERRALLGSIWLNFSTPSNARRSKLFHYQQLPSPIMWIALRHVL